MQALFLLLAALVICVLGQPAGLQVSVTETGLQHAVHIIEPKVTQYLRSLEPINLPPFAPPGQDVINFTQLTIVNTTHTSFSLDIVADKGIKITLGGFGATLIWAVDYYIIGLGWNSYKSVASLGGTTVSFSIQVTSVGGAPNVTLYDDSVVIGSIDVGELPFPLSTLREIIDYGLKLLINAEAPAQVKQFANADIANLTAQYWNNGTTVLGDALFVNYTLTEQPVFTDDYLTISVDATLDLIESGVKGCPYKRTPLPNKVPAQDIQFAVDLGIVKCVIYQFAVQQIQARGFSFYNLLSLFVDASQPLLIKSVNEILTIGLGIETTFFRGVSTVPWIELVGNATIALKADFHLSNVTGDSYANISFPLPLLQVDDLSCPLKNSGIPARYQNQIAAEPWATDVKKINALITSTLAGVLPPAIRIDFPDQATSILSLIGGVTFDSTLDSLTVMIDFAPKQ